MIQIVIYIAIGFLSATVLAFIILPVVSRRAAFNATRAIRENMPFTTAEISAEKDQIKAEHAVALTKVETALDKQNTKATEQHILISKLREKIANLSKLEKSRRLDSEELKVKNTELTNRIRSKETELTDIETRARGYLREIKVLKGKLAALEEAARRARAKGIIARPMRTIKPKTEEAEVSLSRPNGLPIADPQSVKVSAKRGTAKSESSKPSKRKLPSAAQIADKETITVDLPNDSTATTTITETNGKIEPTMPQVAANSQASAGKIQPNDDKSEKAEILKFGEPAASSTPKRNVAQRTTRAKSTSSQAKTSTASKMPDSGAELESAQSKISKFAVDIVSMTARAEGSDSPIFEMLDKLSAKDAGELGNKIASRLETDRLSAKAVRRKKTPTRGAKNNARSKARSKSATRKQKQIVESAE